MGHMDGYEDWQAGRWDDRLVDGMTSIGVAVRLAGAFR